MGFHSRAALAAAVLLVPAAFAGPAEEGLARCAGIADGAARLACYDQLASALKPAAVPAGASAAASAAPVQAQPAAKDGGAWYDPTSWFGGDNVAPSSQMRPEQFGSESLSAPAAKPGEPTPPAPLDSITAKVVDVAFNLRDRFTIFLDNGQIWQQVPGDPDKARFPSKKEFVVTISRGFAGSYNLRVEDRSAVYKVRRIK